MRSEPLVLAALKGAGVVAALVVLVDSLLGCLRTLAQFVNLRTGLLLARLCPHRGIPVSVF